HVGAVQPRRAHPDEDLAGAGLGIGVLLEHNRPVADGYRLHTFGSSRIVRAMALARDCPSANRSTRTYMVRRGLKLGMLWEAPDEDLAPRFATAVARKPCRARARRARSLSRVARRRGRSGRWTA